MRLLVDDFVTDASSMDSAAMIVGTLTTYNPALDLYAVSRLITEHPRRPAMTARSRYSDPNP